MRLPMFSYEQPADLAGVLRALSHRPGARLVAGGTDLLVNMKHRVELPETLVSLGRVGELRGVRREGDRLVIGATTTLKELGHHGELAGKFPALVQAAFSVGSPRHQAMGTLGGNLCQNTRCRFFNQSWQWRQARSLCFKAGGEECHVAKRKSACFATYSGDVAPALLVLDAAVRTAGPGGTREFPLARLYSGDGRAPLALGPGEFVEAVVLPEASAGGASRYEKFSRRGAIEFPIVGAAVWRGDGVVRAAFTGVDRAPVRAAELEASLRGVPMTPESLQRAAALAPRAARIAPTSTHSVAFKRALMATLFLKAMRAVV